MKSVLAVEDDFDILELLDIHLRDMNCKLTKCSSGLQGLKAAQSNSYDLIILDLMLPDMDGLEICRRLRMAGNHTPILMLTAKSEEIDKVLGLETGADDYLTKPFSIRELIARIKAIFRRSGINQNIQKKKLDTLQSSTLQFGDLILDLEKRKVSIANKRISLSPKEYELLALLASNPGKSYPRKQLLNLVWGYDFDGYEHTVNSHINRLRSKVEPNLNDPLYILTTWGVGYRFNEEI